MPKPLKYSGKRQTEYEQLKKQSRKTADEKAAYNAAITRLNKNEKIARTTAKRLQKEKEEYEALIQDLAKAEAARRKKLEERRVAKAAAKNVILDIAHTGPMDIDAYTIMVQDRIFPALNRVAGKAGTFYVQFAQNGEIAAQQIVDIRASYKRGDTIWWEKIRDIIEVGESDEVFPGFRYRLSNRTLLNDTDRVRLVILKETAVPAARIQQKYLDGAVHCVLEPLAALWTKMAQNSDSDASKKRCEQVARKLKSYEAVYPDGVPENDMEMIAKLIHRCIVIHDIVGNEIKRYNDKSTKYFHFTNTRANHLEAGFITMDVQYEPVSEERLIQIMYEHDRDDIFYLYVGDIHRDAPQSIRSKLGAWAVFNENHDVFKEFSKSQNINSYGLNAVKYNQLNEFVREGRLINSAPTPLCDDPNNLEGVSHLDIEKAYTQHKHSGYYRGFLGHITHWCKLDTGIEFVKSHLGIYQFEIVNHGADWIKAMFAKGTRYTLPGPEIEYFVDRGMQVRIIAGCWGSKFDIEYTPEMLSDRRYCTWAGKLGSDKSDSVFTFKGERSWVAHLKSVLGDDNVIYFAESELIVVKIPKKSYYTNHHILAFITSYTRINILNIMEKVIEGGGELVKVIMDGLYYRGAVPDVQVPCKHDKGIIKHLGFRDAWYYPSEIDCKSWGEYDSKLDGSCVLAGAGGTGKSFSVLANKTIIDPLYVVPSHLLGQKGREQYKCRYTTINRLIGAESEIAGKMVKCQSYREMYGEPGVIFIDELTMIDGDWIEKAIQMYPNSVMYIAGDIDGQRWYQCRNGNAGKFSKIWIPRNWRYVYYTEDMRSKCPELREFKQDVRECMRRVFTNGEASDAARVNLYVRGKYPVVPFEEAVAMTKENDVWISGTHKTNQMLLDRGIVSGYINKNKEIVYDGEGEKRGSFTVHSFQGLTIRDKRVFVSLDFFEYAMLYTAISRCVRMDQLVLVADKIKSQS